MLAATNNKTTLFCYTSYTAATHSDLTDYELACDGILSLNEILVEWTDSRKRRSDDSD